MPTVKFANQESKTDDDMQSFVSQVLTFTVVDPLVRYQGIINQISKSDIYRQAVQNIGPPSPKLD